MDEKVAAQGFGAPHRHYRRTDSTNSRARELAEAGAPHGAVVTAAEQSEGRGRQGRSWSAPPGRALLYSAILRPLDRRHLLLPLAVPLAVCEAAEEMRPGIACAIKWPNDIWLDGRKLGGILIEARPQDGWAVIGVGLNLSIARDEFPEELRDSAISLFDSDEGGPGKGCELAATEALNHRLDRWVEAGGEQVLAAWRSRDALRGRDISWDDGSGIADGVDERGNLLVVVGGDRVSLGAGEVHLRL